MFEYKPDIIAQLEAAISPDRLSTYLREPANDREAALKLYLWNSKISSAFYMPLQGLEITLRNFLHDALSHHFKRPDWYDATRLTPKAGEMLQAAKDVIQKSGKQADPPHVVAELSFGFWVSLLNKSYHPTLWIPVLGKAFSAAKLPRGHIQTELENIRILRNRIAHHEPVFTRHLAKDYTAIIKVIGWMSPAKADWIDQHNSVVHFLKEHLSMSGITNTSAKT